MDLYTTLSPCGPQSDYDLQLVTLNDEIMKVIEEGTEKIYIKAPATDSGYPVVCTKSKTFKVRQQNQSNCVMLLNMEKYGDNTVGESFDSFTSRLILEDVEPTLPVEKLPKLTSLAQLAQQAQLAEQGDAGSYSMEQLFADSACSEKEFETLVPQNHVIEYQGNCYVVDDAVVTAALEKMLDALIKHYIDGGFEIEIMDKLEAIELAEARQVWATSEGALPAQLVELCVSKFIDGSGRLQHDKVLRQFGLELLKKERDLKRDDFMINFKLKLPFNYTPEINLARCMNGLFFSYNDGSMISYLDETKLSEDPVRRFQELFALKPQWPVEEIAPFVQRINRRGSKPEKYLLKYCKVRRHGKGHVATAR